MRLLESTCATHAITARHFSFVGTQTVSVSSPPSHAMRGGSLVVVEATASTSANMESPTFIMRPPHAPKSYLPRVLHPLHQPATPNNDEHELHRRLRSQKASNRSFLRRHRNGREGLSHFGNAPHMHTCTQHTHTHKQTLTHGNWRCWRRPDSTVPKLGYTTEGRKGGGISVDQRSNHFLFWEEPLGTDVFWEGMGPDGEPELARNLQANSILCNNPQTCVRAE